MRLDPSLRGGSVYDPACLSRDTSHGRLAELVQHEQVVRTARVGSSADSACRCGGVCGRAGSSTVRFLANRSVRLHPALRLGLGDSVEDAAARGADGTGSVHGPAHPGTLAASGKQGLREPATKNHYSDVHLSALTTCGSTLATREHHQGVPDGLLRPFAAAVQADRTELDLPNLGNQGVDVLAGQQVRPGFLEHGLLSDRVQAGQPSCWPLPRLTVAAPC